MATKKVSTRKLLSRAPALLLVAMAITAVVREERSLVSPRIGVVAFPARADEPVVPPSLGLSNLTPPTSPFSSPSSTGPSAARPGTTSRSKIYTCPPPSTTPPADDSL